MVYAQRTGKYVCKSAVNCQLHGQFRTLFWFISFKTEKIRAKSIRNLAHHPVALLSAVFFWQHFFSRMLLFFWRCLTLRRVVGAERPILFLCQIIRQGGVPFLVETMLGLFLLVSFGFLLIKATFSRDARSSRLDKLSCHDSCDIKLRSESPWRRLLDQLSMLKKRNPQRPQNAAENLQSR